MSGPEPGESSTPLSEFRTTRVVEFADTDMAGIIHFSRYYVYMERAEHEFWNALGTSVHTEIDGMNIGWPRLEASCRFLRPLRFEDEVEIHLLVRRKGTRSLTFEFRFSCREQLVAEGRLATCCCVIEPGKPPRAIAIPAMLADRIVAVETVEDEQSSERPADRSERHG